MTLRLRAVVEADVDEVLRKLEARHLPDGGSGAVAPKLQHAVTALDSAHGHYAVAETTFEGLHRLKEQEVGNYEAAAAAEHELERKQAEAIAKAHAAHLQAEAAARDEARVREEEACVIAEIKALEKQMRSSPSRRDEVVEDLVDKTGELHALQAEEHFAHVVRERATQLVRKESALAKSLDAPLQEAHKKVVLSRRLSQALMADENTALASLREAEEEEEQAVEVLAKALAETTSGGDHVEGGDDEAVAVDEERDLF